MSKITKHPCIACGEIIISEMYVRQLCADKRLCFTRQLKNIGRKVKFWIPNLPLGWAIGTLMEVRKFYSGSEWGIMPDGEHRPVYLCPGAVWGCELYFEPTDWKGNQTP